MNQSMQIEVWIQPRSDAEGSMRRLLGHFPDIESAVVAADDCLASQLSELPASLELALQHWHLWGDEPYLVPNPDGYRAVLALRRLLERRGVS